jgi:hypothetical protein
MGTFGTLLVLACTARADKPGAPAPHVDHAGAKPAPQPAKVVTPSPRGKAILQAQLDAVKHWSDSSAMDATFARSAIVLLPNGERQAAGGNVATAIAFLNPHATVKDATFDHFTSGGNASVEWFTADLHVTVTSSEPGQRAITEKHTVRAIELLDGAADWKVAVAAFTNVAKLHAIGACPIADATPPDGLVNLLVAPDALATALAPGAVVLGTDPAERGEGAAAKTLVGTWKKLKLSLDTEQKAREVHTATYGYGMTNVKLAPAKAGGYPQAMSAFVLALPGPSNTWSVVAASYGATF